MAADPDVVARMLEQLARRIHCETSLRGLSPIQWAALRYLRTAGRQSRSSRFLANFLGVEPDLASRMLVALQFKGLVAKTVEVPDGGEVQLTSIGAAYLAHDPVNRLAAALERMPPGHAAELGRLVEYVSDHLSADECVHGL